MSLANRFEGSTKETTLTCIISGLNSDIKRYVVSLSLQNLLRAAALAKAL